MTAQDLIASSLRLIGVLASGESLGANEATDGLSSLNDMLDSWSTNNLLIPNKTREVFTTTGGTQSYSMGTGATWNTTRPMWIENILVQLGSGANTLDIPVELITKDQFANIALKQQSVQYPIYCYPDGGYPNQTLMFWPIPDSVYNIVIYSAKPLSNLSSLTTVLSLPPGYQRALRYCLATELAPEYGRQVSEEVAGHAAAAVADIKRVNHRPSYLTADAGLLNTRRTGFNWRDGEPT